MTASREKTPTWRMLVESRSLAELMYLGHQVSVVTGGAGHIGSQICDALAELGSSVVIVDMDEPQCHKVASRISNSFGVPVMPLVVDISDEVSARKIPEMVIEKFGRLDVLVNCAAMVGTSEIEGWTTEFPEQSTEAWRAALEVNLTAPFVLIQACTDALAQNGHGSIINIGSLYGVVGPDMRLYDDVQMGNPAAYAVSKAGLIHLTRWLATVLAPRIRVNAISPGGVWRNQPESFLRQYIDRTPLKRMTSEQDIKGAIAFLASDLSSYVTGQNLMVDGGWTAW